MVGLYYSNDGVMKMVIVCHPELFSGLFQDLMKAKEIPG